MHNIKMPLNRLANFVFKENTNDVEICLETKELKTSKELFLFCLDLFMKGLVMLFGNSENKVVLDTITIDQISLIQRKMRNMHIKMTFSHVHYSLFQNGDREILLKYRKGNVANIIKEEPKHFLKDHKYFFALGEYIYTIYFEIVH
jgi:hypothetical protein